MEYVLLPIVHDRDDDVGTGNADLGCLQFGFLPLRHHVLHQLSFSSGLVTIIDLFCMLRIIEHVNVHSPNLGPLMGH